VKRILLMGYFGAGNFGDEALAAAWFTQHQAWMEQHNLAVDILSQGANPLAGFLDITTYREHFGRLISRGEALRIDPYRYRALIAPGGSLLQDATSVKSLLFYLLLIWRFTAACIPVLMLNQGIGPLHSRIANWLAPRVLQAVRMLSLRDEQSFDWARCNVHMRKRPNLLLSADPLLDPQLPLAPDSDEPAGGYLLLIPKANHPASTMAREAERMQLCILLEEALAVSGLSPRVMPLHHGQDCQYGQELADSLLGAELLQPERLPEPRPQHMLSQLARAQLVISHRLHGLVCAAAYGVPALGIAYDPKVSAFCTEIGFPWLDPEDASSAAGISAVRELWQQRDRVCTQVEARRGSLLKRWRQSEDRFNAVW
jgi:polysaccharide pyruvyl transferase CsaB